MREEIQVKRKSYIKRLKEDIISLRLELEERYNDYYTFEIGYEYSRTKYGKSKESYKIYDAKQNVLCDIEYLSDRIKILEDRLSSYINYFSSKNAS